MGTLFKKTNSKKWQMGVTVGGRQRIRSTHTSNKRVAEQMLAQWETQVFEGRFHLPQSIPPYFDEFADDFLNTVTHANTRKRYRSSVGKLKEHFKRVRLSEIDAERIEEYKAARLIAGLEPATINHDLRVLRRMLRIAERKRLIARSPFLQVEFLKQNRPHPPHIVTFEEEEKILTVGTPFLRALVVLMLETGMRSHREALSLKWDAVDFPNNSIRVRESKTRAGLRNIPLTDRCKAHLLEWRTLVGPEFSEFVFPNMRKPTQPVKDVRDAWEKALKNAHLEHFWFSNLRHSYASRLSAAGVTDLFVAQMIGHSSPGILQRYSKAIDEYRRDAVRKLEQMRADHVSSVAETASIN